MTPSRPPRLPARRVPPIAFAHRGAKAVAPENTLEAFELARELGAGGLESDVRLTADGVPVLHHDGVVGRRFRRRRVRDLARADLPSYVPALEDLYATCGTGFQLSLDIKDPDAFAPVVAVARAAGDAALEGLWLCHSDWELVSEWRGRLDRDRTLSGADGVHLVDSTRLKHMKDGPERRAATLSNAGIDAVNLHHSDWTGGLAVLFHRFDVLAFAWDAQLPRILAEVLDLGIDAVYSDHVDRMVEAVDAAYPPG